MATGTAMPELRTPRLTIRPLGAADASACRAALQAAGDAAFERWLSWAVASPPVLGELGQAPLGERAIALSATGDVVGLVGLVPAFGPFAQLEGAAPGGPWTLELGLYWALAPEHRGAGYATEAAEALARYGLDALNAARLVATTDYANAASQRVMKRLGMRILENPHPEPDWFQVVGTLERAA